MSTLESIISRVRDAASSGSGADRLAVLAGVDVTAIESASHPAFDDDSGEPLVVGVPASPGAASGIIALSADAALAAAESGRRVILVRSETTPDDVLGMQVSAGILTSRGGIASHAAVVARGWGIPAVVGAAEVSVHGDHVDIAGTRFAAGDTISIDGGTGAVHAGHRGVSVTELPEEVETLLGWADRVIDGTLTVRANADNEVDARHARHLGARGIGLCRTEHMFLAPDRLPLIRAFILAEDGSPEAGDALAGLETVQQADFEALLRVMDGLPVTVRLLDPPLHEFLPPLDGGAAATDDAPTGTQARRELEAARRLHETNPMIGTRGVRLGLVRDGLYQMQVRALARAIASLRADGLAPNVEIMVPLVIDPAEFRLARTWVQQALEATGTPDDGVRIGVMIETPRAALVSGELARDADFFSFGTNDLTQLTLGFSRDDVEARLMPEYLRRGIFGVNPFATIDPAGVGRLISISCTEAKETNPGITLGACGEQAGDPDSIPLLVAAGVTSLSCSPRRVPIARIAAARALVLAGRADASVLDIAPAPAQTGSPVATAGDAQLSEATEDHVIHVLRVRGFAAPADVAESLGADGASVGARLGALVERGLARHIAARDLYQLTPAGTEEHARVLSGMIGGARESMTAPYHRFLGINTRFKELCTDWQVRDGAPNDHTDPSHDAACIERLGQVLADAGPVLDELAAAMPRLGGFRHRLRAALDQVRAGDSRKFTGVMCGSFHDVWMELHEDLVQLLGIDRVAEGSF